MALSGVKNLQILLYGKLTESCMYIDLWISVCFSFYSFLLFIILFNVSYWLKIKPASFLGMVLSNALKLLCITLPFYVDVNLIKLCSRCWKDGWKIIWLFLWLSCFGWFRYMVFGLVCIFFPLLFCATTKQPLDTEHWWSSAILRVKRVPENRTRKKSYTVWLSSFCPSYKKL